MDVIAHRMQSGWQFDSSHCCCFLDRRTAKTDGRSTTRLGRAIGNVRVICAGRSAFPYGFASGAGGRQNFRAHFPDV